MSGQQIQVAKYVSEDLLLTWDFASQITVGETLLGATVSASVYSGTDATPSNIISGNESISGSVVTQKIIDGTAGVQYYVDCAVTTSLGQVLVIRSFLSVLSG